MQITALPDSRHNNAGQSPSAAIAKFTIFSKNTLVSLFQDTVLASWRVLQRYSNLVAVCLAAGLHRQGQGQGILTGAGARPDKSLLLYLITVYVEVGMQALPSEQTSVYN